MSGADDDQDDEDVVDAKLQAALDRGWDLLGKNDLDGAAHSAAEALAAVPDAPEALTLQGSIAAARGDEEDALDLWEQAIDEDPTYVSPMLYAAELHMAREDWDVALDLLGQAEDAADEEADYLDALLLKIEALLGKGEDRAAKKALAELPDVEYPDASYHVRAGRSCLDLERWDDAEAQFQKAIAMAPDDSDAHHGLGMVHEAREDTRAMTREWLRVRELDLEEDAKDPVPWALTQEEFEAAGEAALAELPERVQELLANVPIVAADYPSIEIVAEGNDPRMMGFFSGVPYPEKSHLDGAQAHLDCVFLYKLNIERMSRNADELRDEIRTTLLHETGHFFGLSEEELEEMGLG
jgi:predicted Zn-dependent protease with MMP-like domain/Tfp pilus assembly protein PilF